jgi:hypothetical protein
MSESELDKVNASYLLVHTDSALDICLKLSPLEVYSADRLKDFRHSRVCGPPGYQPHQHLGEVVLHIGSGREEYLDKYSKFLHVARPRSVYFKEHLKLLPTIQTFSNLCRSILKYGNIDNRRARCQYRINVGCGGQHFPDGIPAILVGKGFGTKLDSDEEFDREEVLSSIGLLVNFIWRVAQDMQRDVGDAPMAPDPLRRNAFARHLCDYFSIDDDKVGFEDITLVISPITSKEWGVVTEHTDVMNDNVGGYSRTCVFNTCFSLDQDAFMHMQVIGNFRRVVRQFMVPFAKSLLSTITNARRYIQSWQSNMQGIYAGVSINQIWDPFDREHFFLDDDLPFKRLQIFGGRRRTDSDDKLLPVHGDYLLTEIGLSRVTSFSMFIDPIDKLKGTLSTDQRIELVFFASLLSNPFWFKHTLEKLTAKSKQKSFLFGIHPIYDVIKELYSTFGGWQGGPHNRWSPCGGTVPVINLFGAHPSASHQDKHVGMEKLGAIIEVLFCHLEWVNTLKGKGSNPLVDLPLSTIQLQWESTRNQIHNIAPCQFSLFRLSVFTTIAIGCNELESGPHLKQMMIPFPGSSSYKHLLSPSKGQMSKKSAADLATSTLLKEIIVQPNQDDQVPSGDHDRLMLYLSHSLGRKHYVRDEMECLLCESHPGRNLDCCDWFCKGQDIYDLRDDGTVIIRSYGKDSNWQAIGSPQPWSFRFLKQRSLLEVDAEEPSTRDDVYYKVDKSLAVYAHLFGLELRRIEEERIIFNGRSSLKSKRQGEHYDNPFRKGMGSTRSGQLGKGSCLTLHHYRSANMFSSLYCRNQGTANMTDEKMIVLGNGDTPKKLFIESNELESFEHGIALLKKTRDTVKNVSREFLMKSLSVGGTPDEDDDRYDSMMAACYHQETDDDGHDCITYFPGHLDKRYIHNVWFVPLGSKPSFTFLAVPSYWNVRQDSDSKRDYQLWLSAISYEEQQSVLKFRDEFERDACKSMKHRIVTSLVFSNKLGSVLQFPPNICFHATVIPGKQQRMTAEPTSPDKYRDLLIFHPFLRGGGGKATWRRKGEIMG